VDVIICIHLPSVECFQVSEDAQCKSRSYSAHPDNSGADNNDRELMSSSGSEGLQRQLSASSSDGLSDKEDVLEAVKSQVIHVCILHSFWG